MTLLTRSRVKAAAKRSPSQVAKLVALQEAQIARLQAEIAARDAVILALAPAVVWDMVDPFTFEVERVRMGSCHPL